jgi:hypothetical protein
MVTVIMVMALTSTQLVARIGARPVVLAAALATFGTLRGMWHWMLEPPAAGEHARGFGPMSRMGTPAARDQRELVARLRVRPHLAPGHPGPKRPATPAKLIAIYFD